VDNLAAPAAAPIAPFGSSSAVRFLKIFTLESIARAVRFKAAAIDTENLPAAVVQRTCAPLLWSTAYCEAWSRPQHICASFPDHALKRAALGEAMFKNAGEKVHVPNDQANLKAKFFPFDQDYLAGLCGGCKPSLLQP